MTTKKRLNEVKGLSEAKVDKIKEIAAKLTVSLMVFLCNVMFALDSRLHHGAGSGREAEDVLQDLDGQSGDGQTAGRRYREHGDHRGVRRVPHRQDAIVAHSLRFAFAWPL